MQEFCLKLFRLLAVAITVQAAALAQAQSAQDGDYINPDRPGIADGSSVVGKRRVQIETGLQHEYRNGGGGATRTLFFPTLVRLGTTDKLEVRLEGNTYTLVKAADAAPGAGRSEGLAPTSIGFKYHIADASAGQPSLAVIGRAFPPSGSRDFRTTRTSGDLRLAADWDFAPQWSLNPNLGFARYDDGGGGSYAAGLLAVTLSYNPRRDFSVFIDVGAQTPEARNGKTAVTVDVGAAWVFDRNLQFDFSVGTKAAGQTPPRLFLAAGISQRF
ncbi:MAG: transporter [Pseudomonadota bacterium]